jgi:hypothetical protein
MLYSVGLNIIGKCFSVFCTSHPTAYSLDKPLAHHSKNNFSFSRSVFVQLHTLKCHIVQYWRGEHRLRVFENRVLRSICGTKRDEVVGGWRKLHNEELLTLYLSP